MCHSLYFLLLSQGQGSFLPVFGVALVIWEEAAGFSLEFGAARMRRLTNCQAASGSTT